MSQVARTFRDLSHVRLEGLRRCILKARRVFACNIEGILVEDRFSENRVCFERRTKVYIRLGGHSLTIVYNECTETLETLSWNFEYKFRC